MPRASTRAIPALGLSQVRFEPEFIERVFLNMPGSKAHALWFREGPERAIAYTSHTIASAWQIKHAADPYEHQSAEA
jgi:hypothetical protein